MLLTLSFFLFLFRHNDLPWNIRKFVHNKLDSVNLTHNLKYIEPWAKSPWSHTDIGRMITGMIGCQVSAYVFGVYSTQNSIVEVTPHVSQSVLWGR